MLEINRDLDAFSLIRRVEGQQGMFVKPELVENPLQSGRMGHKGIVRVDSP